MLKIKKTNNPVAIRSQNLICESFLEILSEKPYDKITITEVCKNANLVRETFYRNFSSKKAVVKRILDYKFEELYELNSADPSHDMDRIFINYFSYWKEEKDFLYLLINNQLFQIMLSKTLELVYIKIDEIIGNRENEKTKKYIASLYSGAINNLLYSWVKNDFEENPDEMARILRLYSLYFQK